MKRGDAVVMMGYPGPKDRNPRHLKRATQSLYVMAKGVDKTFTRARKAGATVLQEPMNTDTAIDAAASKTRKGISGYFAEELKKPPRRAKRSADPKGPRRAS